MVPVTQHPVDLERKRIEAKVDPLTANRALSLLAEVKALQLDQWGISYKDAAHHLYIAEIIRLKTEKEAELVIKGLLRRIDNTIHEIYPMLAKIDNGELDSEATTP